jgi:hypothetical protein
LEYQYNAESQYDGYDFAHSGMFFEVRTIEQ